MQHDAPQSDARNRVAAFAAALLLAATLIPLVAGSGSAQEPGTTVRLEAGSNVEASIAWSQETFDAAAEAFVGRSDLFPDLLASGGPQGLFDAPLLLTDGSALSAATAAELERLGVDDVTVLGGTAAVSSEVEDDLRDEGYTVARIAGPTRIETAVEVAETLFAAPTAAILARAYAPPAGDPTQAFADSLGAGGWAADAGHPVLLTETEQLSTTTGDYLEANPTLTQVFVVGGTQAVSDAVVDELAEMGKIVTRVSGTNRFETAVAIAQERGFDVAEAAAVVALVEGQAANAFASGFAAAAFADLFDAPIVLANDDTLPPATRDFLEGDGAAETGGGAQLAEHEDDVALVCGPYANEDACTTATQILGTTDCASPRPTATTTDDDGVPIIDDLDDLVGASPSPSHDPCATEDDDETPLPTDTTPTVTATPTVGETCLVDPICLPAAARRMGPALAR